MKQETNKLIRFWIWIWYNSYTRLCILLGFTVIPVLVFAKIFGIYGEFVIDFSVFTYIVFLFWAIIDNDFSNLRRIGLDEHRNKLDEHN